MKSRSAFTPADFLPESTNADLLDKLRRPPMGSEFSGVAMTLVLSIRLMASCAAARLDPLVELTRRLESISAAKAVMDLAQTCAQAWPESVMVSRPCCHALTPDEAVLAQMMEAARAADREGFAAVLDGLVRRERHERLYRVTQEAAAAISIAP